MIIINQTFALVRRLERLPRFLPAETPFKFRLRPIGPRIPVEQGGEAGVLVSIQETQFAQVLAI